MAWCVVRGAKFWIYSGYTVGASPPRNYDPSS